MGARPLLVDIFCGGGGAAEGYRRAGFDVIGIDIADHGKSFSRIGEFHQMDWAQGLERFGAEADFIHASPPCQDHSRLTGWGRRENLQQHPSLDSEGSDSKHPRLIGPVREALRSIGAPFVIENVEGAPLFGHVMLCGWMFGYETYRHRLFEAHGIPLKAPRHRPHPVVASSPGHFRPGTFMSAGGHFAPVKLGREVMDSQWMTVAEIAESIPPYFTHYLGEQILDVLGFPVLHPCARAREPGPEAQRLIWDVLAECKDEKLFA